MSRAFYCSLWTDCLNEVGVNRRLFGRQKEIPYWYSYDRVQGRSTRKGLGTARGVRAKSGEQEEKAWVLA